LSKFIPKTPMISVDNAEAKVKVIWAMWTQYNGKNHSYRGHVGFVASH